MFMFNNMKTLFFLFICFVYFICVLRHAQEYSIAGSIVVGKRKTRSLLETCPITAGETAGSPDCANRLIHGSPIFTFKVA